MRGQSLNLPDEQKGLHKPACSLYYYFKGIHYNTMHISITIYSFCVVFFIISTERYCKQLKPKIKIFDLHVSHLDPLQPSSQSQVYVEEDNGKHTPFRQLLTVQISVKMTVYIVIQ